MIQITENNALTILVALKSQRNRKENSLRNYKVNVAKVKEEGGTMHRRQYGIKKRKEFIDKMTLAIEEVQEQMGIISEKETYFFRKRFGKFLSYLNF